jgi:hypothetical protein
LVAPSDRVGFNEMFEHALRGRELPDHEVRRLAVTTWAQFCRYGWLAKEVSNLHDSHHRGRAALRTRCNLLKKAL